jgi:hypothetical protein
VIGRAVAAGLLAALAVSGPFPPAARAGEIEGRVTDGVGRPVAGADVVLSDPQGTLRRTDITDHDGRFFLPAAGSGQRRVSIYSERGARVAVVPLDLPPGGRLWLDAGDLGTRTRVTSGPAADAVPWPSPREGAPRALARGSDLTGALVAVPGTAPPAPPADGPALLGTDPAEAVLRLDGFLLNDPVDGRAPWELPPTLFAGATPVFGLGPTYLRQAGLAEVALQSPRPQRAREASLALAGGLAGAAGEARGPERPVGWSGTAATQAQAGGVRPGGWLRGHLAVAPSWGTFEADPRSVSAMRGRQRRRFPWLARTEIDLRSWNLATVGLGSFDRLRHGRAARITPPRDPASAARDFWLVGATARRVAASGPGELRLQASLLRSSQETVFQGDMPSRTTAHRGTLELRGSTDARLLGWHLLDLGTGVEASWASRPGPEPSRQSGLIVARARASSWSPWVALDDRYRPLAEVELQLGVRLEKQLFRARAEPGGQAPLERSFGAGLLIAPRAQACYLAGPRGGRLCLTAGRFGASLPLVALLDLTAGPPGSMSAPAEDAALALGELRLGVVRLAGYALDRRTAHVIEDRFSPATGRLELHEPRGARRRMQAVAAQAWLELRGTRIGAGLVASRLRGNHVGFVDDGTGEPRPAGTAEWDTTSAPINGDGPLPFDRPWSARVLLEHQRALGGTTLSSMALGRWDAGTPQSARGRSPESGPGQVFLVQRGSLGRTASVHGLDLQVGLSRLVGGTRVSLMLEGFNVTNFRPVVARDQVFTDAAVAPREGVGGRAALAGVVDAEGNPVPARPAFGSPVAWAEPFLLRLGLAVEL